MSQSPKTSEFLQKLKDSGNWNDEYDYSEVNYSNFSVEHETSSQKFVYFDCTKN